jgi:hypothetical protein
MADNFWTNAPSRDPKRQYRFRIQIEGIGAGFLWYAKKADKPEVTVNSSEHKYLGHSFHFPGTVQWNEVSITFVDPVSPDLAGTVGNLLGKIGYSLPANANGDAEFETISKAKAVDALQAVLVEQIDESGRALEQWTLNNAFVSKVNFGALDYGTEDLMEVQITFKYDWATLKSNVVGSDTLGPYFAGPANS